MASTSSARRRAASRRRTRRGAARSYSRQSVAYGPRTRASLTANLTDELARHEHRSTPRSTGWVRGRAGGAAPARGRFRTCNVSRGVETRPAAVRPRGRDELLRRVSLARVEQQHRPTEVVAYECVADLLFGDAERQQKRVVET